MRIFRSKASRVVATTATALIVLALTAPWSGLIRCADGPTSSSCTSITFTAVGGRAWDLIPSLLLAAALAATVWIVLRVTRQRARGRQIAD